MAKTNPVARCPKCNCFMWFYKRDGVYVCDACGWTEDSDDLDKKYQSTDSSDNDYIST